MLRYLTRRLLLLIPVILGISVLVFVMIHLLPGDPANAILGPSAKPQDIKAIDAYLGLDKPIVVQYKDWLGKFVRGDWGESSRSSERVFPMIRRALWNTIQLIFWGILISAVVAVGIGTMLAFMNGLGTFFTTLIQRIAAMVP